ncbi:MAG: 2-phospho-L-lactate transferase [Actinomycetota bacterium]|jgi:LPPG:FO 2-phospho-L-lactate transferase|nr:2-phospho-L-lactate transferase [Actinomycetota bacterium]
MSQVTVIAGGVGAAKFLRGLAQVVEPSNITAVVNVADDFRLHGLAISPDLDTVTYTLSNQVNPETGWGRVGESWRVMEELERYGGETWFSLGDLDLALHMFRTQRLADGATLTDVTAEVARAWELELALLPVSNDPIATRLVVDEGEIDFQDYFVARQHDVEVRSVRFAGADSSRPAPGVIESIERADTIVVAPSNPIVSIGPVLAVPGVRDALVARRDRTVAVSPIVGGAALKGPAARMLTELGHESTAAGVATLYCDFASTLVIDDVDAELAPQVELNGMRAVVADTIMSDPTRAAAVAESTLAALPNPR